MIIFELSDEQAQIAALIDVGAAELLMATGFRERTLIDHRTGWTGDIMREVAVSLGHDIFRLMTPSALYPAGIHQKRIEALKTEYWETDKKITEHLTRTCWPHREYQPLEHVTARLGSKATGAALALWSDRYLAEHR